MKLLLVLPFILMMSSAWSQGGGDRIGNGMPDLTVGQMIQRYRGVEIVCNVRGASVVKQEHNDWTGLTTLIFKRRTQYPTEFAGAQVVREFARKVSPIVTRTEGPLDVPYTVIKVFSLQSELLLFEQGSGFISENQNAGARKLRNFIESNCQ